MWFSRHFFRLPSANAALNSLRDAVTPGKCSWSGAFSYAYAGEIIMWSTFSSSLRKSSTSRTVFGVSVVRNVVFVFTRKPRSFASCDRLDRLVEDPLALDELVVALAHPVEVHDPREVRRRLEEIHLLLHQDRVRAEEDELLPLDQLLRHHVHFGVHERLTAGNRHHRRAGLVDRVERLLHGHALLEDLLRVLDLPAERAREIALEERLELDEQRELLVALDAAAS